MEERTRRRGAGGGLPPSVCFDGLTWRVNEDERRIYRTSTRGRLLAGAGRDATEAEVDLWLALVRAEMHILKLEKDLEWAGRRIDYLGRAVIDDTVPEEV